MTRDLGTYKLVGVDDEARRLDSHTHNMMIEDDVADDVSNWMSISQVTWPALGQLDISDENSRVLVHWCPEESTSLRARRSGPGRNRLSGPTGLSVGVDLVVTSCSNQSSLCAAPPQPQRQP
jgi:hypothetical protein